MDVSGIGDAARGGGETGGGLKTDSGSPIETTGGVGGVGSDGVNGSIVVIGKSVGVAGESVGVVGDSIGVAGELVGATIGFIAIVMQGVGVSSH